jgi:hypothetical protein
VELMTITVWISKKNSSLITIIRLQGELGWLNELGSWIT